MVQYRCEASVKASVKDFCTKCENKRTTVEVIGNDLNNALGVTNFEPNQI